VPPKKKAAHDKAVHRPLHLATPPVRGADVHQLQEAVDRRFHSLKINRSISPDSQLGKDTFSAARQTALALGICGGNQRAFKRHTITESTQRLIRGSRKAKLRERLAAKRRSGFRKNLRKRYEGAPADLAQKASELVGVHEEPPGSNWGGLVEKMIKFTGYTSPCYWCGCAACWLLVHLGGAVIPDRIRLGFAEYIILDAQAGANGLEAVPVSKVRPFDLLTLSGFHHIVVAMSGVQPDGTIRTWAGNTSSADGTNYNGGEIAFHDYPASSFDEGVAARVKEWR
jgi:hypothetical protein